MKITNAKKITIFVLLIGFLMIPLFFCGELLDNSIEANSTCKVTLESVKHVKYKSHRIPMKLIFHNPSDKPIKLVKPLYKKSFIGDFMVRLYDNNNKYASSYTSSISPEELKKVTFEYIEISPKKSYDIDIDLDKRLNVPLKPGAYSIQFKYENKHGVDCVKNFDCVNKPTITIAPPDNLMRPNYLSKKKVLDIAKKANVMKYDKSKPINISLDEGIYTIVFPNKPKGRYGSKYAAKFSIDAQSGKILKSIIAP